MATNANVSQMIATAAAKYGVDPSLAINIGVQESGLNQNAVSPAGAIGVMQLMPATAAGLGVDPAILAQNIDGGVRYIAQLIAEFGDITEAVAAYNWGPGNVQNAVANYGDNWLSVAPAETQNYVTAILGPSAAFAATLDPGGAVAATAESLVSSAANAATSLVTGLTPLQIGMLVVGGYLLWNLLGDLFD